MGAGRYHNATAREFSILPSVSVGCSAEEFLVLTRVWVQCSGKLRYLVDTAAALPRLVAPPLIHVLWNTFQQDFWEVSWFARRVSVSSDELGGIKSTRKLSHFISEKFVKHGVRSIQGAVPYCKAHA